jgi:hypothetical protein
MVPPLAKRWRYVKRKAVTIATNAAPLARNASASAVKL